MKNWKLYLLVAGILFLIAAFAAYLARIASCYPAKEVLAQYTPEYVKGFRQSCKMDSPLTTQFSDFLVFYIPGIIFFSAYWLSKREKIMNHRTVLLSVVLLVLMLGSLLMMLFGLLDYPPPGTANEPAAWEVEIIAVLGFLCYLAVLALWRWKHWGLLLFQGSSVASAIIILLGGGSPILVMLIVSGLIVLSLFLRPELKKLG